MKKKIIIAIVLVLVILIGIIPIIKNKDKNSQGKSNKEFTVYLVDDDAIQRTLLEKYKQKYPNVKVNEVVFDDYSKYYDRLNKDLLAGKGPDVIWASVFGIGRINKLIDSDIFLDLNDLIKEDKEFHLDDYNKVVMESGVYDGKRMFIPFDYICSSLISSKSILENNNISYTENQSYEDFINSLSGYLDNNTEERAIFDTNLSFTKFVSDMGYELIDFKKKEVKCDSDEFKKLVETYKKIYNSNKFEELYKDYENQSDKMIVDKKLLFSDLYSILYLLYYYYDELQKANEEMIYLGNQSKSAYANNIMAINGNSTHQKEAFNFIKMGMSKGFQSGNSNSFGTLLPMNNEAREYVVKQAYNSYAYLKSDKTEAIYKKYREELDNIEKCEVYDSTVEEIIGKELEPYIDDKDSLENCIKGVKDKLNLYLKE